MTGVLLRKGDEDTETHRRKICTQREKEAICKPRTAASEEPKPVDTLILDFKPPNCDKLNFYCLRHSVNYGSPSKLI